MAARPADLEGREWRISQYLIDKEQTEPHHSGGRKDESYIAFENGGVGGSSGCGKFAGKYRRLRLMISAEWADNKETPCDYEEKANAARILKALTNVWRIHVEPPYWREDALLLNGEKGSTQISLLPMQRGKDLSEVEDTFWRPTHLHGAGLAGCAPEITRQMVAEAEDQAPRQSSPLVATQAKKEGKPYRRVVSVMA